MAEVMSQKRRFEERMQLLTPHASSSTQHVPSSPTRTYERVLPSRQYARPNLNGDWFSIGRSSAINDLALPSNNRLVSRSHCKLRYLERENAFEIKCSGFNGVSLQISDQIIYVKRNTGILVQLHEDCDLELNVAGSLVNIERPGEDNSDAAILLPSSPVLAAEEPANKESECQYDAPAIEFIQPLSPLPSSTGMMTPSVTPNAKRVRLDTPSSPLRSPSASKSQSGSVLDKALQPRLLDFHNIQSVSDSSNHKLPGRASSMECLRDMPRGKENVPPPELYHDNQPLESYQVDREVAAPEVTDTSDANNDEIGKVDSTAEVPMETSEPAAAAAASSPLSETADGAEEPFDAQQVDQEFIDMLLTVLATSVISPAPISMFTPFFPANTLRSDIESLLRRQPCVVEHVMTNEFSKHGTQVSTWSYDGTRDTDVLRMTRLSRLQRPQRSLRPRTYQQLHTYEYEHSKYVMDCKAAGIKPVRFDGTRYRRTTQHSSSQ